MTKLSRDEILRMDKAHVWHPYTPMGDYIQHGNPLVIERALGSRIWDADGRSFLDGNSSWWTSLLGHNHPRLVSALIEQASRLCHTAFGGITHEPGAHLAERLVSRAPRGLTKVFYSDNGSTAVEAALKMALQFQAQQGQPERVECIALEHAFHGETMGVTALGGVAAFRGGLGALPLRVHHLPCPGGSEEAELRSLLALDELLAESGRRIAALVVEPRIQGAGGMLMHSANYLRELRSKTKQAGILLIVDEVFTGYGRTGPFWASEGASITPDILCSAKGLSGGILPFAATLTTDEIFAGFLGTPERAFYYGHTYCGNPLGARIALEVLSVYEEEGILDHAAMVAQELALRFQKWGRLPGVRGSRALGVCGAVDLAGESGYLQRGGWKVYEAALKRGAYVRPLGNTVYLCPALNTPASDLGELLSIVEESLQETLQTHG